MIGAVSVTHAGRRGAERLATAWPEVTLYGPPAAEAIPKAFAECDAIICFLAAGAIIRLIAPLLGGKDHDPAVICVDEAHRYAIPLLGGHAAGANDLAKRIADILGAEPVITTATDITGITALDELDGFTVDPASAVAAVTKAILDGERVTLTTDRTWPLPAFPPNVVLAAHPEPGTAAIIVTDRIIPNLTKRTVLLRPPSLTVGAGSSRGVPVAEVRQLIDRVLGAQGMSATSVRYMATAELKADEHGLREAAAERRLGFVTFPAAALAVVEVPSPSEVVRAVTGTPSVAEAAALLHAGPGAELVARKTASAHATVAVARARPRGRLAVVGIGPGARDLLTPRAAAELRRCSIVIGLNQYIEQIAELLRPGTKVLASGLGSEEERAREAVAQARAGHAVGLIGSGDAGVFAMASPALDLCDGSFDVTGVPGVTAALAAASVLGAPLGHDHAMISLSDLHTPWDVIERRVRAAAEADLVVCFYNPASTRRNWQLPRAIEVLAAHRPPETPVGWVRDASRPAESHGICALAEFDPGVVDMRTMVIIGSSRTRIVANAMVTPREYRWAAPPAPDHDRGAFWADSAEKAPRSCEEHR
jgi:cobalt-precorrin 5A hydrolase/precorrin-3B C17-methyltransferase